MRVLACSVTGKPQRQKALSASRFFRVLGATIYSGMSRASELTQEDHTERFTHQQNLDQFIHRQNLERFQKLIDESIGEARASPSSIQL